MSFTRIAFGVAFLSLVVAGAALIAFMVVLATTPKLNSSAADEQESSKIIQQDRDKLNREIGMKAFKKLDQKYGCDASHECYW